jgi:hypothetical protein
MVHYKVDYEVLRRAGMGDPACFQAFCGADLRDIDGESNEFHFIGPSRSPFGQAAVTCPTCKAVYDVIANHNLDRGV